MRGTDGHVRLAGVQSLLGTAWWGIFPCFAALTVRLAHDRACGHLYELLPGVTSSPSGTWPLAIIYVLAHIWILTAWVLYVLRSNELFPPVNALKHAWGRDERKVLLMAAVFAIEYAPMSVWHLLGRAVGCI
jgi:hypothetical protein